MPEWTIRPATIDDRDAALALLERAFGPNEQQAALWDWAFANNPLTSELYYLVADTGDGLAAQYAVVPVAMVHNGERIRGLLSMMTATDPAYQRRGLFREMAQQLYDEAAGTCPLVYAFANDQSWSTFYERLRWVELRPYPSLRRPLRNAGGHSAGGRVAALGARALDVTRLLARDSSVSVDLVDDFTDIADPIWDRFEPQAGTAIVRDERFMNWRFVQSPFEYLRLVAVRDGKPVGLAVLAADSSDGKARLMELMVAPEESHGVTRALLARVIELATESGAYGLGFIATRRHPQWSALLAAGFFPALRALVPGPQAERPDSSFGVLVNGLEIAPNRVLHIDDWHLSGADQDWL